MQRKVNIYRKMLFFVNLPLVVGIPVALEGGFLLDPVHSEKVDSTYVFL